MRLVHSGISVSSEANADAFFEDFLGLTCSRKYTVPGELMNDIFRINGDHQVRLYDIGDHTFEVFVAPTANYPMHSANHLCVGVGDRGSLIEKARSLGFRVYEKEREGKPDLVFIYDHDGNPYEIIED